jgi:putative membrane protein
MRTLAILLGGALALAACSTTPPPPPDLNNPMLAPGFLAQASSANQFEIQSSQLALQASQNPAIHNLANVIIADHTQLGQQVANVAAAAHLSPPPVGLLPAQQTVLDQLHSAGTGYNFDVAWRQAQIDAHQQAIQLMQGYAAGGDLPPLRNAAAASLPMLQRHLAIAQGLVVTPPPPPPPPMPAPSPNRAGERG